MQVGGYCLEKRQGGAGVLFGGMPGVHAASGRCSSRALADKALQDDPHVANGRNVMHVRITACSNVIPSVTMPQPQALHQNERVAGMMTPIRIGPAP